MGSIDADAHVIESEATFAYMDPEYSRLTPIPVTRNESANSEFGFEGQQLNQYWVVDGRLQPRSFNVGTNTTQKEAREMSDVAMRLAHMDE
ncbi:MAG: hypothetical protein HN478_00590, partial [Rhodospirillaceae bacterium]|nr:hypothetical protein [Rhodospirillaceae bacterium]